MMRMKQAAALAALLLFAGTASGAEVQAWMSRTVAPGSGEKVPVYAWGATAFEVDEYRIASDQLDRSVRDGAVVIDTATATPRRTLRFTGPQGEVEVGNLQGVYVYVARPTAGTPFNAGTIQAQAVVVTRLGLAVKRDDGRSIALVHEGERPVAGVRVTVIDTTNGQNRRIGEGTTSANGLVSLTTPAAGQLMFVARQGTSVALQQTWDRSWNAQRQRLFAHVQTDRPLYRPGQTVHYRVILREELGGGGAWRTPVNEELRLFARDAKGQRLALGSLRTSAFGTVSGQVALSAGAPHGEWAVEVEPAQVGANVQVIGAAGFGVQAYRKPEFKVAVTPARASYVQGAQASAVVQADYYFGAPVPRATVEWTVTKRPRWRWWNPWLEPMVMRCIWRPTPPPTVIATGTARTDTAGRATVSFTCARDGEDADYEVSAKVTDASDRQVSGAGSVVVTRAAFDLVALSDRYVYQPGDTIRLRANAQAHDGRAVAGQRVDLKVEAIDPQGAKTLRFTRRLVTDAQGTAELLLRAATKNQYLVTVTAADRDGNAVTAERTIWIHDQQGGTDWAWNQVSIVADKDAYAPGETAVLLVRAPVTHGRALLTLDARSIQTAYSVPIYYGLGLVRIPVTADMAPNIFASVLVPTRDGLVSAEKELVVPPLDGTVEVTVTADKAEYRPGERATFAIKTTDRYGRPIEADVALGIVDEALFALREDGTPGLRDTFFPRRWNEVTTAMTWGGGAVRPLPMMMKSATSNQSASAGGDPGKVREYFPDTLKFIASAVTDARGEATVQETVADNLTTWRLTARAVTRDTKVGETKTTTLVRKDLIVRLAAPRTLVEGDELTLVGIVHNLAKPGTAGADQASVRVRLDGQGVTLLGAAQQTVRVNRGDQARVTWRVRVDSAANAVLEARGDASFDQDALRLTLPVAAKGVAVKTVEAGSLLRDGQVTLRLRKDGRAIDPQSELRLDLTPSLAGTLLESLDYLVGYPYGCIEQTMSKFLPDVVVHEVLTTLGKQDPKLAAELPKMVKDGVDRIAGMQNADGGFGWFSNNESHPYVTAYVAYGLGLARQQGFEVPDALLDGALGFLERSLDQGSQDLDGRAYQAFSLATAGRIRGADLRSLHRDRGRLGSYAKAVLALALVKANEAALARDVLAELDRAALTSAGRCHWDGSTISYGNWSSNPIETTAYAVRAYLAVSPQSPRIADTIAWLVERRQDNGQYVTTKDTAAVVLAFAQHVRQTRELDPDLQVSVTVNGQAMLGTRFTAADLAKAGRTLTVPASQLRTGENVITLSRTGRGALYYSAVLDQKVRIDPITAEDRGVRLRREVFFVDTSVDPQTGQLTERERPFVGNARVGDRLRVRLFVSVSKTSQVEHVNIEDRFPVGCSVVEQEERHDFMLKRGWSWWSSAREVHDDRVVFFATNLPLMNPDSGGAEFEYQYDLRAESAGRFLALPTYAEAVYTPDVNGRSDAKAITIDPR